MHDPTTTNTSEGFNNALALSIPHNASLWLLVKQFQVEEKLVHSKLKDAITSLSSDGSQATSDRQSTTRI